MKDTGRNKPRNSQEKYWQGISSQNDQMKRWQVDFSIQPVCFKQIQRIQPEAVLDRETDMEKIKILISKPMVKIRTLTPCTLVICIIQESIRSNDKRTTVKIASDKQVLVSTTNIYSPTFYLQKNKQNSRGRL